MFSESSQENLLPILASGVAICSSSGSHSLESISDSSISELVPRGRAPIVDAFSSTLETAATTWKKICKCLPDILILKWAKNSHHEASGCMPRPFGNTCGWSLQLYSGIPVPVVLPWLTSSFMTSEIFALTSIIQLAQGFGTTATKYDARPNYRDIWSIWYC